MTSTYNTVYRAESIRNMHGGLGAVINYTRATNDRMVVDIERLQFIDEEANTFWAAGLATILARHVYRAFHLSVSKIDLLGEQLFQASTASH